MDGSVQEIILAELRALRADHNEFVRETGERLARLEANLKTVIGNGVKGRLTMVEEAVEKIQAWRWKVIGGSAVIAAGISMLAHFAR